MLPSSFCCLAVQHSVISFLAAPSLHILNTSTIFSFSLSLRRLRSQEDSSMSDLPEEIIPANLPEVFLTQAPVASDIKVFPRISRYILALTSFSRWVSFSKCSRIIYKFRLRMQSMTSVQKLLPVCKSHEHFVPKDKTPSCSTSPCLTDWQESL